MTTRLDLKDLRENSSAMVSEIETSGLISWMPNSEIANWPALWVSWMALMNLDPMSSPTIVRSAMRSHLKRPRYGALVECTTPRGRVKKRERAEIKS